jgi:ADP-ribosyl-[dinitrogen reductase] hydrolase
MSPSLRDRILGCIVGGAIGDAAGSLYEGWPGTSQPDISPGAHWNLTDDTQLTLATCEAIASSGVVDPAAIAASFLRWFRSRRLTGLGASTLKALWDLDAGAHWALSGMRGERAAGNGAAMRIAPLAFCTQPHDEESRRLIRDVCRITHHHDEAYVGALAIVLAVRVAQSDSPCFDSLATEVAGQLPETSIRERLFAYAGLQSTVSLRDAAGRFGSSGYVVESVPLAIVAAQRVRELGFAGMLEQIVAIGGDTDTNASLACQIAGTALGLAGLPASWVVELPQADMVRRIAEAFADAVLTSTPAAGLNGIEPNQSEV